VGGSTIEYDHYANGGPTGGAPNFLPISPYDKDQSSSLSSSSTFTSTVNSGTSSTTGTAGFSETHNSQLATVTIAAGAGVTQTNPPTPAWTKPSVEVLRINSNWQVSPASTFGSPYPEAYISMALAGHVGAGTYDPLHQAQSPHVTIDINLTFNYTAGGMAKTPITLSRSDSYYTDGTYAQAGQAFNFTDLVSLAQPMNGGSPLSAGDTINLTGTIAFHAKNDLTPSGAALNTFETGAPPPTFTSTVTGSASTTANWEDASTWSPDANVQNQGLGSTPNSQGFRALFIGTGSGSAATRTIVLNQNNTVGTLQFNTAEPISVQAAGGTNSSLVFDGGTEEAVLLSGKDYGDTMHVVGAPIQLNSNLNAQTDSVSGVSVSGVVSDGTISGALHKTGTGMLALSAANTYSAGTTIDAGNLQAVNATGSATGPGPVTINTTGILSGTGTIAGTTTVNSGGHVSPGVVGANNGAGTLTVGSLTLNSGSVIDLDVGSSGSTSDQLAVAPGSTVTINSGSTIMLHPTGSPYSFYTSGTYPLLQLNGANIIGSLSNLTVANPQTVGSNSYNFSMDASGNIQVTVTSSAVQESYNVPGSGSWGNAANWTNGIIPTIAPDSATLPTTNGGPSTTVTLDGARALAILNIGIPNTPNANSYSLTPGASGSFIFNGGSDPTQLNSYGGNQSISAPITFATPTVVNVAAGLPTSTLTISGQITGTGNLTKIGSGTLVLTNSSNSFTGNIAVTGGVLQAPNDGALGNTSNTLTLDGGTLRAQGGQINSNRPITIGPGGATFVASNAITLGGIISGDGGLTKTGSAVLALNGANTFMGPINVAAGVLSIASDTALGDLSNGALSTLSNGALTTVPINIAAGATLAISGSSNTVTTTRNFMVGSNGSGTTTFSVPNTDTLTMNGTLSLDDTLVITGGGTLNLGRAINNLGGTVQINGGTVNFGNDPGGSAINVSGNTTVFNIPSMAGYGIQPRNVSTISISNFAHVNVQTPTAHADRTVLVTSGISIPQQSGTIWAGTLDLGGNDAVVHNATAAAAATTLATLSSQIRSAFFNNGGTPWGGTGITDSAAAADPQHLTTIGVIINDNGSGTPLYGSMGADGLFDGLDATTTDVLMKHTFFGDTDLSGSVGASDYTRSDKGYALHLTGFFNGDFNGDGTINAADFSLQDASYLNQATDGGPLSAVALSAGPLASPGFEVATDGGGAAVPEPSAVAVLALAATALLTRRRKPRHPGEPASGP
jgi:autotransporter-associated beta strand protein